ncbi:MAG: ABC transporter permease [Acidimicrobiales bacterium]
MRLRAVGLVAGREAGETLRGKAIYVATIIFVLAIAALIVLPAELEGGPATFRVAVAGAVPGEVAAIEGAGPSVGARVVVVAATSDAAARAALAATGPRRADLAVTGGPSPAVVVDEALPAGSTSTKALLAAVVGREVSIVRTVDSSGLDPARARALVAPAPLPVTYLRPAPADNGRRGAAVASAVLVFTLVQFYGISLLNGVIREKSGRVVELLLPAVRPSELLAGKVAGSSVIVLAQGVIFAGTALVSAAAVGSSLLQGSGVGVIAVDFVWIILGYLFYAALYAAAGSLAAKPEDAQAVAFPLQLPLLIGYAVIFTAFGSGSANGVVKVLAFLPPTAPLDMPVLAATGGAGPAEVVLAMVVCALGIVVATRLAATIFSRSILHTGGRLKAKQVLRSAPGASLGVPLLPERSY